MPTSMPSNWHSARHAMPLDPRSVADAFSPEVAATALATGKVPCSALDRANEFHRGNAGVCFQSDVSKKDRESECWEFGSQAGRPVISRLDDRNLGPELPTKP